MPIHIDILENEVLGREYKRGRQEGERDGDESESGEGGTEEEVELVVMEGSENLAGRQLRVGGVHTSE